MQITFTGSYISTVYGVNGLVDDFGNDGVADLTVNPQGGGNRMILQAGNAVVGTAAGWMTSGINYVAVVAGESFSSSNLGIATVESRGLIGILFSDTNIRSGALTTGYLDIVASASQPGEKRVTVNRLIFDGDTGGALNGLNVNTTYQTYVAAGGGTSAVPEASTSLGLLALGAGGLFTRRRSKRVA